MKTSIIISFIAAAMSLTACTSESNIQAGGKVKTEKVNVGEFSEITVSGSQNVHFIQSDTTSVIMRGPEEEIEEMDITCKNGALHIGKKRHGNISSLFKLNGSSNVDVFVSSPNMRGVTVTGSGEFEVKGSIDTDVMNIKVAGSGDVDIKDIICNRASVKVSGSGEVEIGRLTTADCTISVTGSGNIDIDNAKIRRVESSVTGSGDINLGNAVIGHAESQLTGSGDIRIKGSVKSHHEKTTGSGDIKIN